MELGAVGTHASVQESCHQLWVWVAHEWQGNSLQGHSEVTLCPALNLELLLEGG